MTDPDRFRRRGPGELESLLFDSLEDDVPPAAARARTLAALGVGSAVMSGSVGAAAKAMHSLGGLGVVKWLAIGAVAGFVTVGIPAGFTVRHARPSTEPTSRSIPARQLQQRTGPSAIAIAPSPESTPLPSPTAVRTRPAPLPVAPSPVPPAPTAGATTGDSRAAGATSGEPPASSLAREVATLDDARRTLSSGDPAGALRRLNAYSSSFPAAALGPEATLLRVQALLAAGDRAAAVELAQRFMRANPGSPHAARMAGLLTSNGRFSDQVPGLRTQAR